MTALTDFRQAFLAASDADSAIKPPVRLAATINITPIGIGQTIDGVLTQLGDRILLTAQTDARQNGVRVVSDGIWAVPGDWANLVTGTTILVTTGTANSGEYSITTANPIIQGTSLINITQTPISGIVAITGGSINNATIGNVTPSTGAFTTISATGQITSIVAVGTPPLVVASTTQVANLNAASAGSASTVTTNANLTGPITSVGNATSIASGNAYASPTFTGTVSGTPSWASTQSLNTSGNAGTVTTNANLTGGVTSVGNAATVVTNANLTGAITSIGNTTSIASGNTYASPTFTGTVSGTPAWASTQSLNTSGTAATVTGATQSSVTTLGGYTPNFTSAETAIPASTGATASVAHGLGAQPSLVEVVLRNKTIDLGYAVGDEVLIASSNAAALTLWANATTLGFTRQNGGTLNIVTRAGGFTSSTITEANWKIVFRAWA